MTEATSKKNKKAFVLLILAFALPVILAKFALEYDWFNKAATNKGELLQPPLDFSGVEQPQETPKWRIAYVMPENCEATCDNALYSINQVWVALGKHMDRAEPVVVVSDSSDAAKVAELNSHPNIKLLKTDVQNVNKVFKQTSTDGIFLIDTLDNVILRYPLQQEQQQAVLFSRDILADLRKLLKLSRIG